MLLAKQGDLWFARIELEVIARASRFAHKLAATSMLIRPMSGLIQWRYSDPCRRMQDP
jgi:hypothetical protein